LNPFYCREKICAFVNYFVDVKWEVTHLKETNAAARGQNLPKERTDKTVSAESDTNNKEHLNLGSATFS
jgi:hypothetical protein